MVIPLPNPTTPQARFVGATRRDAPLRAHCRVAGRLWWAAPRRVPRLALHPAAERRARGVQSDRLLSRLLRSSLADDLLVLHLTPEEAFSLALALAAVCDGTRQDELYLSPIASDRAFTARIGADGAAITLERGELHLDWPQVAALAALLGEAI